LIKAAGKPMAAPSANSSGKPSPTKAQHVYDDLNGKVKYILDGGQCGIGLESTVLDLSQAAPMILRSGEVTKEQIEEIIGEVAVYGDVIKNETPRSPGLKYRHYSPKAKVFVCDGKKINSLYDTEFANQKKVVIMCLDSTRNLYGERDVYTVGQNYKDYAKNLFACLRQADDDGYDVVIAESVPDTFIGAAINNRLKKASGEF